MVATLGGALARIGRADEARAVLAVLVQRAGKEYVRAYIFAMLHAFLGEEDRAFMWLEKAREERDVWLPYWGFNPDSITTGIPTKYLSAPRRAAILERLGIIRS